MEMLVDSSQNKNFKYQMTLKCKCHFYILPLVLFLSIISSWYLYVIIFCIFTVHNIVETVLYIVFFNILFVLLLWSFLACVFTPVAKVPSIYKLTDEEIDLLRRSDGSNQNIISNRICSQKNIVLQTRYPDGQIRYCQKCKQIKPDRARHCSSCGVCVLKMDHHCPWINNCAGFSNYKDFILFLFYTTVYCAYILSTATIYTSELMEEHGLHVVVVCLTIVLFYGGFSGTMLVYHCLLVIENKTSIDKLQDPVFVIENGTYNLGCRNNFLQVFGNKWLLWPFPVFTSLGSGCTFPFKIVDSYSTNV